MQVTVLQGVNEAAKALFVVLFLLMRIVLFG